MTTNRRDPLNSLWGFFWEFFCSLKLTVFLLITLAITSIIGTIIPQGTPAQEYLHRIGTAKFKLYQALGFFDMYHSWWFILLLYLLTLNLLACSVRRLPSIWKAITRPVTVMDSGLERSLANVASFKAGGEPEVLQAQVAALIKARFAGPVATESAGARYLFAQKHPWCRLSVYLVHLSVIVVFAGAIVGSLFGYKGFVNIMEGDSASRVLIRSGKEISPGFAVRCEKFGVSYYKSGAPKEFKSILTVLENGKPVPGYEHVPVIVNQPLTYKGVTFYQSSYGNAGNYRFLVTDPDGGNAVPLTIPADGSATLPDGSEVHVLETTPDIAPYSPGLSGPAAHIEIHAPGGVSEQVVVYGNHPELNAEHAKQHGAGPVIHFKGEEKRMYTGLQVAKDPGVGIVWLGCLLMVAGIFAAFFLSHRRIWVRIQHGTVTVGGNASKNQPAFRQFFDGLVDKLTTECSRGKR